MTNNSSPPSRSQVLVVGAGISGLSCAARLSRAGLDVRVVEASDAVGGRVRTDVVDGFLLDRGFQVILTAYDEIQALEDLASLDLRPFQPGSLIWNGEALQHMGDPWRDPGAALPTMRAAVGTLGDKMKVAGLRRRVLAEPPERCFDGQARTTQEELEAMGFTPAFIDGFFRPFLGGVFLERALETSSKLFRYYFRCFSAGDASLPAGGMQRLADLLAAPLEGRITLNTRVDDVSRDTVKLSDGSELRADQVVLAADGAASARLLGQVPPAFKATVTAYFATDVPPTDRPMLVLDGEGTGPANHVAVVSRVAPSYAPAGAHLVSVSGVDAAAEDPEGFHRQVVPQLRRWFGSSVDDWRHLRTYHIPQALPCHPPGSLADRPAAPRSDGIILAGDHTEFGALQGALRSGRRAAEAVLDQR